MIRYALKCAEDHRFESWFQSGSAFDGLASKGLVCCPVCGGTTVEKAVMAPRVSGQNEPEQAEGREVLRTPTHPVETMLKALREHVEKHSTYVGRRFASEARAMHLGEREEAAIHGEVSKDEARALLEEGVPVAPIPIPARGKSN